MSALLENDHAHVLSLNGPWRLTLGDQDGIVNLPGVWERQGYPLEMEGPAVYTRTQHVPAAWAGSRIMLRFGAVSYRADVYVNGHYAGMHEGLWTSFEFDVSEFIRPGQDNFLEVRVIKPGDEGDTYPYRDVLVGFIPYVALPFGGPWRDIELISHNTPAWQDIRLKTDWQSGRVEVHASINGYATLNGLMTSAEIVDQQGMVVARAEQPFQNDTQSLAFALAVTDPKLWSPANPVRYSLHLTLYHNTESLAHASRSFGFRELHADGEQLLLNGQKIHLRGILSWGWQPDTLAPTPTDAQIRDEFRRVRELGFNLYKMCLYVPPPHLFEIADEEGMLLWLELPLWWQRLNDHLRQQAPLEYADMLQAVHHHPSLVLVSLGCELGADMADAVMLDTLNTLARSMTCGTLLCDNSGSGEAYKGLGYDFADFTDYHFYCDLHYFIPLMDHFRRDWLTPRPWIFGEFCANEDYRDPSTLADADGGRPWWRDVLGVGSTVKRWAYIEQEARMAAHKLPLTDKQLEQIARSQSLMVRKLIIEQARARRDGGGYVVTVLRDTPITTSGVFDDFGRSKCDPADFRAFNDETVLLLEQGRARVWMNGDRPAPMDRFNYRAGSSISLRLILAHAGADLPDTALHWELIQPDGSTIVEDSVMLRGPISAGPARQVIRLEADLPEDAVSGPWQVRATLGTITRNTWTLWVYPSAADWPQGTAIYDPAGCLGGIPDLPHLDDPRACESVLITSAYTSEVASFVQNGGRALLLQTGDGTLPAQPVGFWQESIKLLTDHPVLRRFPHEGTTDLQFYHLAGDYALDGAQLAESVPGLVSWQPVIRRLHARTFTMLEYLIECEAGSGVFMASTLRFCGGAGDQVVGLGPNVAGDFLLREMAAYISAKSLTKAIL